MGSARNKSSFGLNGVVCVRQWKSGRDGFEESREDTMTDRRPSRQRMTASVTLREDAVGNVTAGGKFVGGDYFKPQQLESEKQKAGEEPKAEHGILRVGAPRWFRLTAAGDRRRNCTCSRRTRGNRMFRPWRWRCRRRRGLHRQHLRRLASDRRPNLSSRRLRGRSFATGRWNLKWNASTVRSRRFRN